MSFGETKRYLHGRTTAFSKILGIFITMSSHQSYPPLHSPSTMGPESTQLDVFRLARVLRVRIATILATVLVVCALIVGFSLTAKPNYRSTAELVLESSPTESLATGVLGRNEGTGTSDRRQTEIQILLGSAVSQKVYALLKNPGTVVAKSLGGADVIVVEAESDDAATAAATANAYAQSYIDFRRGQAVDDLLEASKRLQVRVTALVQRIAVLDGQLSALSADSADRLPLQSERNALDEQRITFQNRTDAFQIDAALRTGGALINRPATVPKLPTNPSPIRSLLFAFPLGLLAGIGLAFMRDAFDDTISEREDVENVDGSHPVLAAVPAAERRLPMFAIADRPSSSMAESFRSLRTALQFLGVDRSLRVIQVTSALPGEGKTTVASNLAVSLAQGGQRVVLIDADLRVSSLNDHISQNEGGGLSSMLVGSTSAAAAAVGVDAVPTLQVIPAGFVPPNPAELLGSNRMRDLIKDMSARFDFVVVDSPPLLPVADPLVLSEFADAVIVVVRSGKSTKRQLARATQLLRSVNAPLVGFVLNQSDDDTQGYGKQLYAASTKKQRRSVQKAKSKARRSAA